MTLEQRIAALALRMGTECKALRTLVNGNLADLAGLATTAKTNLVAAINEVRAMVVALGTPATISDGTTGAGSTWSSQKISDQITAATNALVNGAPGALDTLKELADAVNDDAAFSSAVTTALGNRLRFDAAQTLTAPQKVQVCANAGAAALVDTGNLDADFAATFVTALA
jgi:hypothetical protein